MTEKDALDKIANMKCFCHLCFNLQHIAKEKGLQAVIDHESFLCSQAEEIKFIAKEWGRKRLHGR